MLLQPQEGEEGLEVVVGLFDLADHSNDLNKKTFKIVLNNIKLASYVGFTDKICHFERKFKNKVKWHIHRAPPGTA